MSLLRRMTMSGGAAVRWTPYALPLTARPFWVVAKDHGTVNMTDDGAGLISAWISRNTGLTVTASLAARPTFNALGFASAYPAVVGDGLASVLNMTGTAGLPTADSPGALFLLGSTNSVSGLHVPLVYGGPTNGSFRRVSGTIANQSSDGLTTVTEDAAVRQGGWGVPNIGIAIFEPGSYRLRGHGMALGEVTTGTLNTGTSRLCLFASSAASPASFWDGPICEAMIYNGVPSVDLCQRMEGYWAWEYPAAGIVAALPNDHPYKAGPP